MNNNGSMKRAAAEDVEPLFGALSFKQRAFVLHYVENSGNATQAAKAAGRCTILDWKPLTTGLLNWWPRRCSTNWSSTA